MRSLNNNILIKKNNPANSIVIGLDSYKLSKEVIKLSFINALKEDKIFVLISENEDLCDTAFMASNYYNKPVSYLDISNPDCPYYNILAGTERDVINKFNKVFLADIPINPNIVGVLLRQTNQNLAAKSIKVLKRLYGDDATLLDLDNLLNNTGGQGKKMIDEFVKMPVSNPSMARENSDIAIWFLNDYYSGLIGERGVTKTYEYTHNLRTIVSNLNIDTCLKKVLNPPRNTRNNMCLSMEKCLIINLSAITDDYTKNNLLKYLLSDLVLAVDSKKEKILYSDINMNESNVTTFKEILNNSKKNNMHCILSTSDMCSCNKELSGHINNYILSNSLSIGDCKYFKKLRGYLGLHYIDINEYNTISINGEQVVIEPDLDYSVYQKDIIIYQYEKKQKEAKINSREVSSCLERIDDCIKNIYFYDIFKDFFPSFNIREILSESNEEHLQNIYHSISDKYTYESCKKIAENKIDYDVYKKTYYRKNNGDKRLKDTKAEMLHDVAVVREILYNIRDMIEKISPKIDGEQVEIEIKHLTEKYSKIVKARTEQEIYKLIEGTNEKEYTLNLNCSKNMNQEDDFDILGLIEDEIDEDDV